MTWNEFIFWLIQTNKNALKVVVIRFRVLDKVAEVSWAMFF